MKLQLSVFKLLVFLSFAVPNAALGSWTVGAGFWYLPSGATDGEDKDATKGSETTGANFAYHVDGGYTLKTSGSVSIPVGVRLTYAKSKSETTSYKDSALTVDRETFSGIGILAGLKWKSFTFNVVYFPSPSLSIESTGKKTGIYQDGSGIELSIAHLFQITERLSLGPSYHVQSVTFREKSTAGVLTNYGVRPESRIDSQILISAEYRLMK